MKKPLDNMEQAGKCPICSSAYGDGKALLLEADARRSVFHVTCAKCNTSSLVFISMGQAEAVSMGVLTDMERTEAKRLFGADTVSADDVLAVYGQLKDLTIDI